MLEFLNQYRGIIGVIPLGLSLTFNIYRHYYIKKAKRLLFETKLIKLVL